MRLKDVTIGTYNSTYAGGVVGAIGYLGEVNYGYSGSNIKNDDSPLSTTIKNVAVRGDNSTVNSSGDDYSSKKAGTGGIVGFIGYGDDTQFTYNGNVGVYGYPGKPNVVLENIENYAAVNSYQSTGGGIVGQEYRGSLTIKNSANHGRVGAVTGNNDQGGGGGIVGKVSVDADKLTLSRVSNDAYVKSYANAGGLVGYLEGYTSGYSDSNLIAKIEESWNEGKVKTYEMGNQGGIVGYAENKTLNISKVFNLGTIEGYGYAGGIIGYFNPETSGSLINSYNSGDVIGSGDEGSNYGSGGIIGAWHNGNISNVYNSGTVTDYNAGGLIGGSRQWVSSYARTLSNAYNIGTVQASDTANVGKIGGIITATDNKITFSKIYTTGDTWAGSGTIADSAKAGTTDDTGIEAIWSSWNSNGGTVDKTGGNSSAVWRVYQNPKSITDTE